MTDFQKPVYHGKGCLSMPASFSALRAHTVKGQARRRGTKEEEFP
ncbi:hypothetical protein HMPREF1545_02361 [Oscillibacter sp. KLE 1728]|nr:hypothetical protein HMPREF1546_04243 [Oscillibacter sp. KLE 1745]ERK59166.1 hypothetical protein HMPREF1545_02361 [Oscillibacter sp. KLE 1728]